MRLALGCLGLLLLLVVIPIAVIQLGGFFGDAGPFCSAWPKTQACEKIELEPPGDVFFYIPRGYKSNDIEFDNGAFGLYSCHPEFCNEELLEDEGPVPIPVPSTIENLQQQEELRMKADQIWEEVKI